MSQRTIVELDLVGYSDLARDLEQQVGVEVVARFNDQIQEFVDVGLAAIHSTREDVVRATTGDGAILVFNRAVDAHEFAVVVLKATRTHNAQKSLPSAERWFRVGIATGEMHERTRPNGTPEIAGTVIANAVRLESAARPGQIVMDSATFALLPKESQAFYDGEEIVEGKRSERFVARRYTVVGFETQRPPTGMCPYVGLRAFREEDAAFYAGRTAFIEKLVDLVADRCSVIGVVGSSGSGKSSVVMAGLIPELRKRRPPHPTWDAFVFKPGRYPWRSLADALVHLRDPDLAAEEQSARAAKLVESLKSGNGAVDSEFARTLSDSRGTDRLLVVIDQFEEWMIHGPTPIANESQEQRKVREEESKQRKQFLEDLLEVPALRPVTIVLTLRADYYSQAISYSRKLSDTLGSVNLGPMTEAEVRATIEEPAKRVGLAFEPGLVDRILKDVTDEPGALPLLEYLLTAVWSAGSQTITKASYEKAGGVAGSIAEAADNVYRSLAKGEQEACQQLFTRLVHVTAAGAEGADTRQVVRRSQLLEIHWEIARRFADSGVRLLVMGRDRSEETIEETIEVAHEQLIRSWPRLCNWVNENRDFLVWRAQLGAFIETWRKLGSGNNGLLEGRELRTAQQWMRRKTRDLNGEERTFIRKGSSRKRISRAAVALIAVAVLSAAVWAEYQQTDYAQVRAAIRDANDRIAQISDPKARSGQQSALAEVLAKAGRMQQAGTLFEEAQKTAGQISEPGSRSLAQSAVAEALAKAGKLEEAQKAVGQISEPGSRSLAQSAVAEALAKAGKLEEAQKIAGQISEPSYRSFAQSALAEALAKAGRMQQAGTLFEEAQKAAWQISEPSSRSFAQSALAEALAKAGKLEEAQKAVGQISAPRYRSEAQSAVAEALAKAGKFEEAQKAVGQISEPSSRSFAQSALAEALVKAGRMQQARTLFEEAQKAAWQISESRSRSDAQRALAEALAKAGKFQQARSLADQLGAVEAVTVHAAIITRYSNKHQ